MKNWKNAEIVEVSISATASGDCHTGTEKGSSLVYPNGQHDGDHCSEGYSDNFFANIFHNFMEGITAGDHCHGVVDQPS